MSQPVETRVVLIRHGESRVTVRREIGGYRTCDGLSELGRAQAERLRDRLESTGEVRPDVLYASNFARAIETAELIRPALGVADVVVDAGFGEHDPGPQLDGLTFAGYVERYGTPDWHGDPHYEVFEGGETMAEFHLRVGSTLSRVLRERAGQSIVIACHGGVINAVLRETMRLPATGSISTRAVNTSLTEFIIPASGLATLVRYNDAAHLAGLPDATPTDEGHGEPWQREPDD